MATVLADIANNAGIKIGGFGEQLGPSGQVTTAQLTANTDPISKAINTKYPVVRKKVIKEFAALGCPFRETMKFHDLGPDLKQYDIAISSIEVAASTVVTITTQKAHGRATGANSDTVYLDDIRQDSDEDVDDIEQTLITSLNGTAETIIVTSTTAFTIATAGVEASWVHEANTGLISYVPDMGPWRYAFILPKDFFCMVRQTDESPASQNGVRTEYQHQPILNRAGDGSLLLTNDLTNLNRNSAYIEYCIDQTTFAMFSPGFEESIAMLLAAELCPVVGRDLETRQAIIAEYKAVTIPEAKAENQSQLDNSAHYVPDYSGGRSSRGVVPGRGGDLGTYITAGGLRRKI